MSEDIEAAVRATGRSCGECSLCCKLPPIDTPELQKQANTWCPHCRPGKGGCSDYETRPTLCRNYRCLWLKDTTWARSGSRHTAGCICSLPLPGSSSWSIPAIQPTGHLTSGIGTLRHAGLLPRQDLAGRSAQDH
jgi:Fe-S-cluster containining protein